MPKEGILRINLHN